MYKSLFFKEFTKTHTAIIICALVVVVLCVAAMSSLAHDIRLSTAESYMAQKINSRMRPLPLLSIFSVVMSLSIAAAQFVPEALSGRLKLTLHLPLPESTIVYVMCLYGWLCVVVLSLLASCLYFFTQSLYLPVDFILPDLVEIFRQTLVALVVYNITAAVCFDPRQRGKLRWGACGLITLFALWLLPDTMRGFMPLSVLIALLSTAIPFVSACRFKAGLR